MGETNFEGRGGRGSGSIGYTYIDRWNFQRKQEARKINVRVEAKAISILETNYLGRILAPREASIPSNWRRKYFLRDDEDFSSRRGSEGEKSRFERSLSLSLSVSRLSREILIGRI